MISFISSHSSSPSLTHRFIPAAKFFCRSNLLHAQNNFVSELSSSNHNFNRFFSKAISSNNSSTCFIEEDDISPDEHYEVGSQLYNKKDFDKAVAHFKSGAEKNHANCMNAFARCLYYGHGVKQDFSQASQYFQNAADKGHKEAQYFCGFMHLTGSGRSKDIQKAANYLKSSADQDYGAACFFYAYLLMGGTEAEESQNSNSNSSQETNEDRFARTGQKAFEYLSKGSELGNPACQCAYGIALFQGENIKPDKRKGVELIKKSCNRSYPRALNFYGNLLAKGVTVFEQSASDNDFQTSYPVTLIEKDEKVAADMFAEAASQFDAEGCYNYGVALLNGKGVKKDTRKALVFIKKSANLGFAEAICDYASFYEKGIEVKKDIQKAASLYKQAADLGCQSAAVHYGQMCMDGIGVKKDVQEAAKYFKLAMKK